MSQTRPTKIVTITNDEIYDLATHQARLADSARVVIPVASQAERDGLAAQFTGGILPVPTFVSRTDLKCSIWVWDGVTWAPTTPTPPSAHMGKTAGGQAIGAGLTAVTTTAAQVLRGGFTFDGPNNALVVPITGYYRATVNAYATSSLTYTLHVRAFRNNVTIDIGARVYKGDSSDISASGSGIILLNAGDKINLWAQGFGTNAASAATLGNNGYDGVYLEVEYHSPNVAY